MSPQPTVERDDDHDDADTASQRSLRSLSLDSVGSRHDGLDSIRLSPTSQSGALPKRVSHPHTLDTDFSSEADDVSLYADGVEQRESPNTSAAPSMYDHEPVDYHYPNKSIVPGDSAPSTATYDAVSPSVYGESEPSPLDPSVPPASSVVRSSPTVPLSFVHGSPPIPRSSLSPRQSLSPRHSGGAFIPMDLPPPINYGTKVGSPTYPPSIPNHSNSERDSVRSFASGSSYSRKARPESLLLEPPEGPIVLGIALVDFNHLIGPKIEFAQGDILDDDEISKVLPFLALPDGAHLSVEDYSYFHVVPSRPNATTAFGISCNRQIASSSLLVKGEDVTRSTVQKAVVVLASKPVFGPIRDRLGVVTRALFNQRDFTEMSILADFGAALEISLRTQLTESGLYMGTSLREFVHTFRQRSLVLVKALMLQKRIMFYGHPVERLCTYQYSLISLLPGLLQMLDDCGSPPLATRAPTLSRPTSLRTSDRKSMLTYLGLPLDIFGKDAFFQPYLPLQQLDMLKETKSSLCGSTNSIVTQQKEIDLLVNVETGTLEFRDPKLERSAGLTAADRKWMDDIIKDVNDGWNEEDPSRPINMHFKGSDDYLRAKFEEYVFAALASVKYRDFVLKGEGNGVLITGGSANSTNSFEDFNPLWIYEFKRTNAYDVWERTTDPILFDIVEARHPCNEKPSVVSDFGLRLQEGIQELKLDQQLAPTREAITRSFAVGSTNLRKAMEGVGRWARDASTSSASLNELINGGRPRSLSRPSTPPVEITIADADEKSEKPLPPVRQPASQLRQLSLPLSPRLMADASSAGAKVTSTSTAAANAVWGGIGSFWSTRPVKLTLPRLGKDTLPVPPDSATSVAFEGINPDSPPIRDLDEHPRSPYPTVIADTP